MFDRRWFLGLLGSLPFFRKAQATELNENSIETALIHLKVYASEGEMVTCENNHFICAMAQTVCVGQMQKPEHFKWWIQPQPKWGQYPIPGCQICGAPWTNGTDYHFADGWRTSPISRGLRISDRASR